MAREMAPDFLRRLVPQNYYDIQQVCMNGHQITDQFKGFPEKRKDHCNTCGEKTIHECPICNADIKGYHKIAGAVGGGRTPVPEYCDTCGKPFPWIGKLGKREAKSENQTTEVSKSIELVARRLHLVAKQVQRRHGDRETLEIADEYDVQDLVHSLLCLFFDDIRTEEWTPSYAGGSSRMDFLLKQESIVVETKKSSAKHLGKEIGEELISDIAKYRQHQSCKKLYCIIYDPDERIVNPHGLESDLSKPEGDLEVVVIVTPRRS